MVSKTALKIVVGVVLAVLLLGVGLKVLKVASTLLWLIMIPLLGSILGLAISYLIKRVILPKGSPHRENPAITTGAFATGWLLVLLSSCS